MMKEQGWKGTNISKMLLVIKLSLDPKLHWEEKQSFHSEQETDPLVFCETPPAQNLPFKFQNDEPASLLWPQVS